MDSHSHSERLVHSLSSRIDPLHPQSALYRVPTALLHHGQNSSSMADSIHGGPPRSNSYTCLPSAVLDPNCDPSSVDFRNFFPYIPNEVKHRKRTTRDQQKVLETIFDRSPKPDGALRQRLAKELDMTPRGVQVWFQNRRAKEKSLGKKIVSNTTETLPSFNSGSQAPSPNEVASPETDVSPTSNQEFQSSPPSSSPTSSSPSSPRNNAPISTTELPHVPWNSQSLSPEIPNHVPQHGSPPQAHPDLYNLRRGSLPTHIHMQPTMHRSNLGPSPAVNILARRGSVERLGGNPYARYVMTRPRVGPYQSRPTSLRESHDHTSLHSEEASTPVLEATPFDHCGQQPEISGPDRSRPYLGHRASMPHVYGGAHMQRRSSMPTDAHSHTQGISLPTSTLRMPNSKLYAISSRPVPAPTPGPLPSENFSFGSPADPAPSPAPADQDNDYTDQAYSLQNYSFGPRDEIDVEDDATSAASYDAYSRFGSIASMAGSESSNTSAYYSDAGSCNEFPPAWNPDTRRGSYASSGQFLDLSVSGIDLAHGGHVSISPAAPLSSSGYVPYSLQEASGNDCDSLVGTHAYPSPSSTVSPGDHSPSVEPANDSTQSLPISGSSELAHALHQTNHKQAWDHGYSNMQESSTVTDIHGNTASVQYQSPQEYEQASQYPLPLSNSSSSSSLHLPIAPQSLEKTHMDNIPGQYPLGGHYQDSTHIYHPIPSAESRYSATGTYSPHNGQDILELHHAMEFQNSGYVGGGVDISDVTSAVENTLHAAEPHVSYQ